MEFKPPKLRAAVVLASYRSLLMEKVARSLPREKAGGASLVVSVPRERRSRSLVKLIQDKLHSTQNEV